MHPLEELAEAYCPDHPDLPWTGKGDPAKDLTCQVSEHLSQQPAINVLVSDAHDMADNYGGQGQRW